MRNQLAGDGAYGDFGWDSGKARGRGGVLARESSAVGRNGSSHIGHRDASGVQGSIGVHRYAEVLEIETALARIQLPDAMSGSSEHSCPR